MARYNQGFLPPAGTGYFGAIAAPAVVANQQLIQRLTAPAPLVTYGPSYQAHRQLRRAERDITALAKGFTTGKINLGAFSKAAEDLRKTYGENVLQQIPEWRNIQGTEGAYQNAINVKKLQTAVDLDIDPNLLKWNPQEGDFIVNPVAKEARQINREDAEVAQAPILERQKMQLKLADEHYDLRTKLAYGEYDNAIAKEKPGSDGWINAGKRREAALRRAEQDYRDRVQFIHSGGNIEQRAEETRTQVLEQASGGSAVPQAPALSHPKLPPGAKIVAAYESPAEFGAAKLKPNTYVIAENYLLYIDGNGNPRAVK